MGALAEMSAQSSQHDVVPERIPGKNRRPRPFKIEWRFRLFHRVGWSDWHTRGRYRTRDERDNALAGWKRVHAGSDHVEFRIVDDGP